MTKSEILKLIEKKESVKLELKPSLADIKRITEVVCSFANAKGGTVLIGVSDTGKIKGIDIGKKTIEHVTDKIVDNIDPKIYPEIKPVKIDEKSVILVSTEESPDKPHLAHGKPFMRVGKNTKAMSRNEYERQLLQRHKEKLQFDLGLCKGATLKDIDSSKLRWFLEKAKETRGFEAPFKMSSREALERLDLMEKGKLNNTAILLFGKRPQKFFVQAKVRCGRLKGTAGHDFIDMKILEGTIPELREGVMKFAAGHIRHAVYFDANQRYDKWEYPLRALEEVITNALAHRDYFSNSDIQLAIYDDRIEVWNPGMLPAPLTPEDLKRKHKSIPRNKLLASQLFLIKHIERWGTGTNRVIDEMKAYGLPEPIFQNLSGGFEVTLHGPGKSFEEEIEKEKLHKLDINPRQKKAIEYTKDKGSITRSEYMKINKISHKTAHLELKYLVEKKLFEKEGKGKATRYMLKR